MLENTIPSPLSPTEGNGETTAPLNSNSTNKEQQIQQQLQSNPARTVQMTPNEGPAKEHQPVAMPETVSHAPTGSGKPVPLTPQTPPSVSYSDMLKRNAGQHHSKTTTKEIWKNIRSTRTTIASNNAPLPPVFTRSNGKYVAALVFGYAGVRADLVHAAILDMDTGGKHLDFEEDRALIHFDAEGPYHDFLQKKVEVAGTTLLPQKTLFSTGQPLLIRAHHVTHGTNKQREEALQSIFALSGIIRHVDFHVIQSGSTVMTTPVIDFVLDIKTSHPQHISIPRLANVMGINCLFTWANMGEICYKCGQVDHVKARCTQKEGYARAPAVLLPQLSLAFPPTTPKPSQQPPSASSLAPTVNYAPGSVSLSSPNFPVSEWQTQGEKKKKKQGGKRPTTATLSDTETPPKTLPQTRKKIKMVHKNATNKDKSSESVDVAAPKHASMAAPVSLPASVPEKGPKTSSNIAPSPAPRDCPAQISFEAPDHGAGPNLTGTTAPSGSEQETTTHKISNNAPPEEKQGNQDPQEAKKDQNPAPEGRENGDTMDTTE